MQYVSSRLDKVDNVDKVDKVDNMDNGFGFIDIILLVQIMWILALGP